MYELDDQSEDEFDFIEWDDAQKELEDMDGANGNSHVNIDRVLKDA